MQDGVAQIPGCAVHFLREAVVRFLDDHCAPRP